MIMKEFLKEKLPDGIKSRISSFLINAKSYYFKNDLNKLAKIHHCDKGIVHSYTHHYQDHFNRIKNNKLNILEIGVGGYKSPVRGGASLRMWKKFFRKSKINGIDIYDKSGLEEKRIKTFRGSQIDENFLESVIKDIGPPDIIIDDGSHMNDHIIKSFKILFPRLKAGGVYVIEDIQTSYWESYGGNSKNIEDSKTAINYFRSLINGLNHKEFMIRDYEPNFMDRHIVSMHFYHNLIFIYKGENSEPSSYLIDNLEPCSAENLS